MEGIHLAYLRDISIDKSSLCEPRTRKPARAFTASAAFIMVPTRVNSRDTAQDVLDEWVVPKLAKQFLTNRKVSADGTRFSRKQYEQRCAANPDSSAAANKTSTESKPTSPRLVKE